MKCINGNYIYPQFKADYNFLCIIKKELLWVPFLSKILFTYFKILILNVGQFRTHNKKFIFSFAVKIASAKIKAPEAKVEITI